MQSPDLERCQALPLFAQVSAATLHDALAEAQIRSFPAGAVLVQQGEAVNYLHILLTGQVELEAAWNDHETVLAVVQPLSTFTLAAVVLDADSLNSARTLEQCEILLIPAEAIRRAMVDDAQFSFAVSRDLAGDFRTMVRTVKNQKLRSGVERLANYLVALKASEAGIGHNVVLRHEKRILASLLGMTPENLSRAFAALRKVGILVNSSIVTVTNANALRSLARPDLLIDNHAPRNRNVATAADAEVWATQANRAELASHCS